MIVDYAKRRSIDTKNEASLQQEIINFIKDSDFWLYTSGLGELLDTDQARIHGKKMGYTSGTPDLMIFNSNKFHSGILIELKCATGFGKVSKVQLEFLKNAERINPKLLVIISNNLCDIIEILTKYKHNIFIDQSKEE